MREADELPPDAAVITSLSNKRFRITDMQDHCIVIKFEASGNSRPLQRE